MLPLLLGLGFLAALAGAAATARPRKVRVRVVPELPPPRDVRDAANALERSRNGEASAEDYEVLAEAAEMEGAPEAADVFRQAATMAPEDEAMEEIPDEEEDEEEEGEDEDEEEDEGPIPVVGPPEPIPVVGPPEPLPVVGPPEPIPTVETAPPAEVVEDEAVPDDAVISVPDDFEVPEGFNPSRAASMAQSVADDVSERSFNYSRPRMREFQLAAGLVEDGIYGAKTRGALDFYDVDNPPPTLFRPHGFTEYSPLLVQAITDTAN